MAGVKASAQMTLPISMQIRREAALQLKAKGSLLKARDSNRNRAKEALIKSLSDFILGFLCNASNSSTRIASYLRQQSCIGLLSQDNASIMV